MHKSLERDAAVSIRFLCAFLLTEYWPIAPNVMIKGLALNIIRQWSSCPLFDVYFQVDCSTVPPSAFAWRITMRKRSKTASFSTPAATNVSAFLLSFIPSRFFFSFGRLSFLYSCHWERDAQCHRFPFLPAAGSSWPFCSVSLPLESSHRRLPLIAFFL